MNNTLISIESVEPIGWSSFLNIISGIMWEKWPKEKKLKFSFQSGPNPMKSFFRGVGVGHIFFLLSSS